MHCPPSEIHQGFKKRMDQAMAVSYFKYGPVAEAFPHKVNAIKSLEHRLRLYKETGNRDYLVDVANFAAIEFRFPCHESGGCDEPTDGGEGRYWHAGGRANERANDGSRATHK